MNLRCLSALALAASAAVGAAPAPPHGATPATPTPAANAAACHSRSNELASGITSFRDCDGAPEMIGLRGGHYKMGDLVGDGQPYERPAHEVQLAPFALGRFEVTNAEWKICVAAGGCAPARVAADDQHGRYPVAGVSWTQARQYAEWLAARTGKPYRLPSESEWEYAARAGAEARYPWGSFDPDPCTHANILDVSGRRAHPEWTWGESCDDQYADTAPVGSFKPNEWGFYDMLGNVWEWVADCWHSDYQNAPGDGSVWLAESCRKHVNRGGGFGNNVHSARLSSRDGDPTEATSSGLGLRVARSITPGELPGGVEGAPDARPVIEAAPMRPIMSKKVPVGTMIAPPATAKPAAAVPVATMSLATERQMDVHLTVKGEQHWSSGAQHSDATTVQDYLFSARLRSDGALYADNLLDPDPSVRVAVKHQYLARRGLILLKAQNGGKLPHTAEEQSALMGKVQAAASNCHKDSNCKGDTTEMYAAIESLQDNTVEDLEALIATPATGKTARWLYFFGYGGCPSTVRITQQTHIAGERANDREKKNLVPWSLERSADASADAINARDAEPLCRRYVVTVDTRSGAIFVENFYIPAPRGLTVRSRNGKIERVEEELPVPQELQSWTGQLLAPGRETMEVAQSLPANTPLDGDYTALGQWDGKLDSTMSWSFKPVPGAPLAVVPAAAK